MEPNTKLIKKWTKNKTMIDHITWFVFGQHGGQITTRIRPQIMYAKVSYMKCDDLYNNGMKTRDVWNRLYYFGSVFEKLGFSSEWVRFGSVKKHSSVRIL